MYILEYTCIYIKQIANGRRSPVFAFNTQTSTKHSTWSNNDIHVNLRLRTDAHVWIGLD